ncbi:hypothetical protein HD806DRAFT_522555 [Xylariaceae sp. AK1471]|nr:hypothetical protein HD806DRAFT_522555 [Xylariaceae sp. AK1471]
MSSQVCQEPIAVALLLILEAVRRDRTLSVHPMPMEPEDLGLQYILSSSTNAAGGSYDAAYARVYAYAHARARARDCAHPPPGPTSAYHGVRRTGIACMHGAIPEDFARGFPASIVLVLQSYNGASDPFTNQISSFDTLWQLTDPALDFVVVCNIQILYLASPMYSHIFKTSSTGSQHLTYSSNQEYVVIVSDISRKSTVCVPLYPCTSYFFSLYPPSPYLPITLLARNSKPSLSDLKAIERRRLRALFNMDCLTATLPNRNSNVLLDEQAVEDKIKVLNALKNYVKAELLQISHSCTVCENSVTYDNYGIYASDAIAETLVENARLKVEKLQGAAMRMKDLDKDIKKFEAQAVMLSTLRDSLRVIIRGTNAKYTLGLHPRTGEIIILIVDPGHDDGGGNANITSNNNRPQRQRAINLMDSPLAQPISSPVLIPEHVSSRVTTASPAPASSRALTPALGPVPESLPITTLESDLQQPVDTPQTGANGHTAKIWENEDERRSAMEIHEQVMGSHHPKANPLMFVHGVQYMPSTDTGSSNDNCRMVIFSNLQETATIHDVLTKVRGGKILRAVKVGTTASVSFFDGREAYAYVKKVNSLSSPLKVLGKTPRVALAGSASYPIDPVLAADVLRGNTRVLAIPNFKKENISFLLAALNIWGQVEDYYYKKGEQKKPLKKNPAPVQPADVEEWAELMADWPQNDDADDEAEDAYTLYLSFRDIAYATAAHKFITSAHRFAAYQHLVFAPDPCARSLEELES